MDNKKEELKYIAENNNNVAEHNDSHLTGKEGEDIACRYILKKGYEIIERNYRKGRYEIDIIAEKDNTLVFFEVKRARSVRFGNPSCWVTPVKIKRITSTALGYITDYNIEKKNLRFDVISIETCQGKNMLNHIENAFSVPEEA